MNESSDELITLLAMSATDIQTIAQARLGRELNTLEIETLIVRLRDLIVVRAGWPTVIGHCIEEMAMSAKFEHWLQKVNEEIWAMATCSVEDLPDFDYYSLFVVGSTPEQAAGAVLLSIGFSRFE